MVKKRLAAILLMVALSVSAVFPAVSSYASESDDAEKEKVEQEDSEHDYEDTNRANKIQELEDSIKEKQDQIKKAEDDRKKIKSNITDIQKMVDDLEKEKKKLTTLENEVAESLLGSSKYSPDLLNKLISQQTAVITQLETDKENIQAEMANKKKSMESVKPMYDIFKGWADEFDTCSLERKKMIISQLISRIELSRGYDVKIELDMN